jgi:hypothetical protein
MHFSNFLFIPNFVYKVYPNIIISKNFKEGKQELLYCDIFLIETGTSHSFDLADHASKVEF